MTSVAVLYRAVTPRVGRRIRLVTVAVVVLALGAGGVYATTRDSPGGDAVVGDPPVSYVIEYRTAHDDGPEVTETLTVQRPFRSLLTGAGPDRVSDLGVLATGGDDQAWSRIEVPVGPALGDAPLLHALDGLPDVVFERRGTRSVAGRRCEVVRFGGPVTGGVLTPLGRTPGEYADICIDGIGLVLAERWVIDDVEVRDREATAVTVAAVDADAFGVPPAAIAVSTDDGGGAVAPADPQAPSGFAEDWYLVRPPPGFHHVGRWAVVPPTTSDSAVAETGRRPVHVALVTDAWTRGPDLVVLDQGAAVGGAAPPWSPGDVTDTIDLGNLGGTAVVADAVWGTALNELRFQRPDGGFVRLAGTLPMADLIDIGRTLTTDA